MLGVMQHLDIHVCEDSEDAVAQGFNYAPPIQAVDVVKVVVIRKGTKGGNATVDFLMEDQYHNKYVFMVTAALLKSIPV